MRGSTPNCVASTMVTLGMGRRCVLATVAFSLVASPRVSSAGVGDSFFSKSRHDSDPSTVGSPTQNRQGAAEVSQQSEPRRFENAVGWQEHQETQQYEHHESDSSSPLSFSSTNEYPAVLWVPWVSVAEPHKEATLTAKTRVGDPEVDLFMWSIPLENGAVYEGR